MWTFAMTQTSLKGKLSSEISVITTDSYFLIPGPFFNIKCDSDVS